jgi:thioesterase domain-containing protein
MAWQMQPYQTYLKNLVIAKVPGNHWSFLVEPETFNQTVAEFLEIAKQ